MHTGPIIHTKMHTGPIIYTKMHAGPIIHAKMHAGPIIHSKNAHWPNNSRKKCIETNCSRKWASHAINIHALNFSFNSDKKAECTCFFWFWFWFLILLRGVFFTAVLHHKKWEKGSKLAVPHKLISPSCWLVLGTIRNNHKYWNSFDRSSVSPQYLQVVLNVPDTPTSSYRESRDNHVTNVDLCTLYDRVGVAIANSQLLIFAQLNYGRTGPARSTSSSTGSLL